MPSTNGRLSTKRPSFELQRPAAVRSSLVRDLPQAVKSDQVVQVDIGIRRVLGSVPAEKNVRNVSCLSYRYHPAIGLARGGLRPLLEAVADQTSDEVSLRVGEKKIQASSWNASLKQFRAGRELVIVRPCAGGGAHCCIDQPPSTESASGAADGTRSRWNGRLIRETACLLEGVLTAGLATKDATAATLATVSRGRRSVRAALSRHTCSRHCRT
jgi:hypothetical protein